jgi:DNA-binding XRE family transcriptional regulator
MPPERAADILARGRARRLWRAGGASGLARLVRTTAGLTQAEMAALLKVDRSAVSRWEASRRTPRAEVLARYMAVLDRLKAEPK